MSHEARAVVVGSGFVGSAIAEQFEKAGISVRKISRHAGGLHVKSIDVTVGREALAEAFIGANVVVHAVSYVGPDTVSSHATNVEGTRNIAEACRSADVDRLFYISTTAVYGYGPHHNAPPDIEPRPASVVSGHRLTAERIVAEYGGHVLRPHLMYGNGDRLVLAPLGRFLLGAGGIPDDAESAMTSLLDIEDLGRLVVGLALNLPARIGPSTWNAVPPQRITVFDLCQLAVRAVGATAPSLVKADVLRSAARAAGMTDHQYDFALGQRTYDPGLVWEHAGCANVFSTSLSAMHLDWYCSLATGGGGVAVTSPSSFTTSSAG